MFEEREENGKKYRLFWEEATIYHPEAPAGLIYSMADHKEVWRYKGSPDETVDEVKKRIETAFEDRRRQGLL